MKQICESLEGEEDKQLPRQRWERPIQSQIDERRTKKTIERTNMRGAQREGDEKQ